MANIAKPSAIFVTRSLPRAVYFHTGKQSGSASSVLLYFTLKGVLTEDIPLKLILTCTFMNKQMCFFVKNVSIEPQFNNIL